MAMVEADDRFGGSERPEDSEERRRAAEQRCLEAEQRCFQAERRRFEAERRREQAEALLAQARRAGIKMEQIVGELRKLVASLREVAERSPRFAPATATEPAGTTPAVGPGTGSGEQMVDALTLAIARLRANVEAVGEPAVRAATTRSGGAAEAAFSPTERRHGQRPPAMPLRPPHKHSMSWIARWRARRKQRR